MIETLIHFRLFTDVFRSLIKIIIQSDQFVLLDILKIAWTIIRIILLASGG